MTVLELNIFLKKFVGNKNIKTNICTLINTSIRGGYFWIGFINFVLIGKTLINYTSLFSLYDFKKMTIMNETTNTCSNLSDHTKFRLY